MNDEYLLPFPKSPWMDTESTIWLASQLQLLRNVEKFSFPGKISIGVRKKILHVIQQSLLSLSSLPDLQLFLAEELTPTHKEFLYEHYLSRKGFHQAHAGEAFILDPSGTFLAVINIRNHLQLIMMDPAGELERSWNQLSRIEGELSQALQFAFSSEFGFLTADPKECGTALNGSIFLHLPALIHTKKLPEVLKKHEEKTLVTQGLLGGPEALIGDVLAIHNRYTLGLTEESILSSLRGFATHIMLEEKSVRQNIQGDRHHQLMDEVARALGLLKFGYQLETVEAMGAISLMKLGLDIGWIQGTSMGELNRLFFHCRRAHLINELNQDVSMEELSRHRASYLKQALKEVELN